MMVENFGSSDKEEEMERPPSICDGDLTDHIVIEPLEEGIEDSHERVHRYEKGIFNPNKVYDNTVGIAGVGALGSQVAIDLIKLGVSIFLIDPDEIEASNLSRSFYTDEDIGRPKPTALAKRLKKFRLVEGQRIEGFWYRTEKFKEKFPEKLKEIDLMVIAIDNDAGVIRAIKIAKEMGIPYVVSSISENSYLLRVFAESDPRNSEGCYWDYHPGKDPEEEDGCPCPDAMASPSIIYPHSISGGWVGFAVKAILNEEELGYKEININLKEGKILKRSGIESRKDCPICNRDMTGEDI